MKIKNFIIYIKKKKNNNCIKCNLCVLFCPKNNIFIKKNKILIKNCNFCCYCYLNCKIKCIK